ncbi:MAG TPA: TraR/DksA C4-type zinc finger protein [Opitutales bacterium]|nr:TraR/DksA C4-type zinc finger protein [Opitutales bacterium]
MPPLLRAIMDVDFLIDRELAIQDAIRDVEARIREGHDTIKPPGQLDGTEGRLSRQDSLMRHEMDKAGVRSMEQSLEALKEARLRIDRGTYGRCLQCGREISKDRLLLIPAAECCTDCLSS